MPRRVGPPRERYKFGPGCSEVLACDGSGVVLRDPCRYRPLCRGYAPIDSPGVKLEDRDGTVYEKGTPSSDFLFILEALGPDEVALGRNAIGPTGGVLDRLLADNTPLSRRDITLVNPVRCRPIAHDGDVPATLDYNGDNVSMKPSTDQVRECMSRYFDKVLAEGQFKYIVCLGATAAYAMLGRAVELSKYRGTIFSSGEMNECSKCAGIGKTLGVIKRCKACKGKGTEKCGYCRRYSNHTKGCSRPRILLGGNGEEASQNAVSGQDSTSVSNDLRFDRSPRHDDRSSLQKSEVLSRGSSRSSLIAGESSQASTNKEVERSLRKVRGDELQPNLRDQPKREKVPSASVSELSDFETCEDCKGSGSVTGLPKKCSKCDGAGDVPLDSEQPHVCKKLKPGQLMMITYHPAFLMRAPGMWPVVERDFQRITKMEEELSYAANAIYDEYPPPGHGIANEILEQVSNRSERTRTGLDVDSGSAGGVGAFTDTGIASGTEQRPLTIDLETTGLDADSGQITHFAFTDRPGYGCVLHPDDPRVPELLQSPVIVGQNIVLFDWWWLERHGFKIPASTSIVDTRFLGKLINPDTPNDLSYLTSELADPPLRGFWKAKDDYRKHIERVACIDVDATTRVAHGAWNRLERTGQAAFARDYIIPISRVVFETRLAGMRVDKSKMEEAQIRIYAALAEKRGELPDWGGARTEGQHAKVQEHLYAKLKLPVRKKRGTWAVTADRAALDELAGMLGTNHKQIQHLTEDEQADAVQFIATLQELRDMSKLVTSFLRYKYSASDMVHPELNPVGTATLRPTCSDPNILQVPGCKCKPPCHGTEKHLCGSSCTGTNPRCKNARWVFIPDQPDWEIMSVDISQAEVIGFLWYAQQWDVLASILNKGQDAYQIIANKIKGRDATTAERDATKVDTLAFIYGESDRTQSLRLRIPIDDIKHRRQVYLAALPGVQDFREEFIRQAIARGFVESPWGVRRYIRVESKFGRAANEACNAPIQNICPMITGHAMLKLHAQLPKPARLWMPWVYDELNFVYPKEMRQEVYTAARDVLGAPVRQMPALPIGMGQGLRFKLDFAVGESWGHMSPLRAQS